MKFPVRIKHRKPEAVVYGQTKAYPFYRVAYRVGGKRQIRSFATYGEAKQAAEAKVRELAVGNQLLGELSLGEAVEGYLRTVATVKRKGLSEAVEEFIALRAPKAVARDGKRSILAPKYFENTSSWIRAFAKTFPGHCVGDLTKEHLNLFVRQYSELSPESRNDRRAVVKLFFGWCVRNDFLPQAHRLLEADAMQIETLDTAATTCYTPEELRALLEGARGICAR